MSVVKVMRMCLVFRCICNLGHHLNTGQICSHDLNNGQVKVHCSDKSVNLQGRYSDPYSILFAFKKVKIFSYLQ